MYNGLQLKKKKLRKRFDKRKKGGGLSSKGYINRSIDFKCISDFILFFFLLSRFPSTFEFILSCLPILLLSRRISGYFSFFYVLFWTLFIKRKRFFFLFFPLKLLSCIFHVVKCKIEDHVTKPICFYLQIRLHI